MLERGMQEEGDAAAGLCTVPWQLLHSAQASSGPQLPSWEQLGQQREVSTDSWCCHSGVQEFRFSVRAGAACWVPQHQEFILSWAENRELATGWLLLRGLTSPSFSQFLVCPVLSSEPGFVGTLLPSLPLSWCCLPECLSPSCLPLLGHSRCVPCCLDD